MSGALGGGERTFRTLCIRKRFDLSPFQSAPVPHTIFENGRVERHVWTYLKSHISPGIEVCWKEAGRKREEKTRRIETLQFADGMSADVITNFTMLDMLPGKLLDPSVTFLWGVEGEMSPPVTDPPAPPVDKFRWLLVTPKKVLNNEINVFVKIALLDARRSEDFPASPAMNFTFDFEGNILDGYKGAVFRLPDKPAAGLYLVAYIYIDVNIAEFSSRTVTRKKIRGTWSLSKAFDLLSNDENLSLYGISYVSVDKIPKAREELTLPVYRAPRSRARLRQMLEGGRNTKEHDLKLLVEVSLIDEFGDFLVYSPSKRFYGEELFDREVIIEKICAAERGETTPSIHKEASGSEEIAYFEPIKGTEFKKFRAKVPSDTIHYYLTGTTSAEHPKPTVNVSKLPNINWISDKAELRRRQKIANSKPPLFIPHCEKEVGRKKDIIPEMDLFLVPPDTFSNSLFLDINEIEFEEQEGSSLVFSAYNSSTSSPISVFSDHSARDSGISLATVSRVRIPLRDGKGRRFMPGEHTIEIVLPFSVKGLIISVEIAPGKKAKAPTSYVGFFSVESVMCNRRLFDDMPDGSGQNERPDSANGGNGASFAFSVPLISRKEIGDRDIVDIWKRMARNAQGKSCISIRTLSRSLVVPSCLPSGYVGGWDGNYGIKKKFLNYLTEYSSILTREAGTDTRVESLWEFINEFEKSHNIYSVPKGSVFILLDSMVDLILHLGDAVSVLGAFLRFVRILLRGAPWRSNKILSEYQSAKFRHKSGRRITEVLHAYLETPERSDLDILEGAGFVLALLTKSLALELDALPAVIPKLSETLCRIRTVVLSNHKKRTIQCRQTNLEMAWLVRRLVFLTFEAAPSMDEISDLISNCTLGEARSNIELSYQLKFLVVVVDVPHFAILNYPDTEKGEGAFVAVLRKFLWKIGHNEFYLREYFILAKDLLSKFLDACHEPDCSPNIVYRTFFYIIEDSMGTSFSLGTDAKDPAVNDTYRQYLHSLVLEISVGVGDEYLRSWFQHLEASRRSEYLQLLEAGMNVFSCAAPSRDDEVVPESSGSGKRTRRRKTKLDRKTIKKKLLSAGADHFKGILESRYSDSSEYLFEQESQGLRVASSLCTRSGNLLLRIVRILLDTEPRGVLMLLLGALQKNQPMETVIAGFKIVTDNLRRLDFDGRRAASKLALKFSLCGSESLNVLGMLFLLEVIENFEIYGGEFMMLEFGSFIYENSGTGELPRLSRMLEKLLDRPDDSGRRFVLILSEILKKTILRENYSYDFHKTSELLLDIAFWAGETYKELFYTTLNKLLRIYEEYGRNLEWGFLAKFLLLEAQGEPDLAAQDRVFRRVLRAETRLKNLRDFQREELLSQCWMGFQLGKYYELSYLALKQLAHLYEGSADVPKLKGVYGTLSKISGKMLQGTEGQANFFYRVRFSIHSGDLFGEDASSVEYVYRGISGTRISDVPSLLGQTYREKYDVVITEGFEDAATDKDDGKLYIQINEVIPCRERVSEGPEIFGKGLQSDFMYNKFYYEISPASETGEKHHSKQRIVLTTDGYLPGILPRRKVIERIITAPE